METKDNSMIKTKPYNGDKSFIFISYAHKDKARVMPVIDKLLLKGYRVWYDEGIDPGTEWDENIASHIYKCDCMVAFLSQNYINSENCKDELNYARTLEKGRLLIYLEETKLPPGMDMRLNRIHAIYKYVYNEDDFYVKLYDCDILDRCLEKVISQPTTPKKITDTVKEVPAPVKSKPQKAPKASTTELLVRSIKKFTTQNIKSSSESQLSNKNYIFISASTADYDSNNVIKQVIDALNMRNIPSWRSDKNIISGENYNEAIAKAIQNCSVVLLFLSTKSSMSAEVESEIICAKAHKRLIIPVRIEPFENEAKWQYILKQYQVYNLFKGCKQSDIAAFADYIKKIYKSVNC